VIKEALEFLAKLQTPKNQLTVEVGGQTFAVQADGTVGDAVRPVDLSWPTPVLPLGTLSGIVAAYSAKVGNLGDRVALHIVSHLQVDLIDLDENEHGKRRVYAQAKHTPDAGFKFNRKPFSVRRGCGGRRNFTGSNGQVGHCHHSFIALFEIDAKWQLDTVGSIRSYLEGALPSAIIIA